MSWADLAAEGMRRVADQGNTFTGTGANRFEFSDIRGAPEQVHRKNGCSRRRYFLFDGNGIDAKRVLVAIHKHRLQSIPQNTVRSGMERETWDDYFAVQIKGA